MLKRLFLLIVLGTLLGSTASCGRMRAPDQPPGSTYPRTYPAPE